MQCSVASNLALYCLSMSWKKGKSYMGYVTTIIMSLDIHIVLSVDLRIYCFWCGSCQCLL